MHVLILPSWYFPPGTQVIAGRMFHQLASGLREEGVDAQIFFANLHAKGPLSRKASFQPEEGVPTWRVNQFHLPKRNATWLNMWIKRQVAEVMRYINSAGKPDLLHAQSYLMAAVCAELQNKTGIQFLYTERLSTFLLGTIPKHHIALIQQSMASASRITAVSPGMKEAMRTYTDRDIDITPNYYSPDDFNPAANQPPLPPFTWVTVGEPAHVKGYDILLQAFARLKESLPEYTMQLLLVDLIAEQSQLEKMADELGIRDNLIWKGFVVPGAMPDILRQCHAFVSSSRVETFGKSILEAQACGLPVAATQSAGASFILQSAAQGELALTGNPTSLADAMRKVMVQYDTYVPAHISDTVRRRFEKSRVIRQWIDLYQTAMA